MHQPGGVLRFGQKRFARLFPLHWLTLLLSIALWAIVTRFVHVDHAPSTDPKCIVLTAALLQGIFPCGNGIYYNFPNWSLSVEIAMYALYPLLAWLIGAGRRMYLGFSLLLFLAIGMYAFRLTTGVLNWTDLYDPLRALPSFMLGTALAANRDLLKAIPAAQPLSLLSFAVAVALALTGGAAPLQLAAMVLAGTFAIAADTQGKVAGWTAKVAPLGQLTYSLYLWHVLVIMVLMNGIADKLMRGNTAVLVVCTVLTYVGIAILSYLSWRYFETPARIWLDGWFRRRNSREARA
ncbi:MAG: acyltransferase [Proteobacteria bacterium]|nr:acyltransferase [Pseudomonadota bacterium]